MAKNHQVNIRLDGDELKLLLQLSEATQKPVSEVLRSLIPPSSSWVDALIHLAQLRGGGDIGAALYRAAADGLKREIETSDHGIKKTYTGVTMPHAMPSLFLQWSDGLCTMIGVGGPLGNEYELVKGEHGFVPEYIPKSRRKPRATQEE